MWKVCVLLAVAMFMLVGCDMARRIDQSVWTNPGPEIEGEAPPAQPIVEIIGGL